MAALSRGERVLSRARSLMANKGYSYSKALELAALTVDPEPEPLPPPRSPRPRPHARQGTRKHWYAVAPERQAAAIVAELAQQPPSTRTETQARVLAILASELRRHQAGYQHSPSALWQARTSYGITLADIESAAQEDA